jgi:hypothetical protein
LASFGVVASFRTPIFAISRSRASRSAIIASIEWPCNDEASDITGGADPGSFRPPAGGAFSSRWRSACAARSRLNAAFQVPRADTS